MSVQRGLDLLDCQFLGLTHEVLQVAQRQVIETHGAELADDVGIAGGGQRETAGQLTLGVIEFFLGGTVLEVVGEHVLHQFQGAFAHLRTGLQVDHERAAGLHRREAGIYAVGQAALFPHLGHQSCAEAATAEDLVAQGYGGIVRIVSVDAQLREHQVGLLGRKFDVANTRFGLHRRRGFRQGRAFGQRGGYLVGNRFGFGTGQIPTSAITALPAA